MSTPLSYASDQDLVPPSSPVPPSSLSPADDVASFPGLPPGQLGPNFRPFKRSRNTYETSESQVPTPPERPSVSDLLSTPKPPRLPLPASSPGPFLPGSGGSSGAPGASWSDDLPESVPACLPGLEETYVSDLSAVNNSLSAVAAWLARWKSRLLASPSPTPLPGLSSLLLAVLHLPGLDSASEDDSRAAEISLAVLANWLSAQKARLLVSPGFSSLSGLDPLLQVVVELGLDGKLMDRLNQLVTRHRALLGGDLVSSRSLTQAQGFDLSTSGVEGLVPPTAGLSSGVFTFSSPSVPLANELDQRRGKSRKRRPAKASLAPVAAPCAAGAPSSGPLAAGSLLPAVPPLVGGLPPARTPPASTEDVTMTSSPEVPLATSRAPQAVPRPSLPRPYGRPPQAPATPPSPPPPPPLATKPRASPRTFASVAALAGGAKPSALAIARAFPHLSDQEVERMVSVLAPAAPVRGLPPTRSSHPSPPPAAPTSRPAIVSTTKGPSRRQILASFSSPTSTSPSPSSLVEVVNRGLVYKGSKLRALSATTNAAGSTFDMSGVASEDDLVTVREFLAHVPGISTVGNVCLPRSKSYMKLVDVPCPNGPSDYPSIRTKVTDALAASPLANHLPLASAPRPVRNSRSADTATVWFEIWDSQTGANASVVVYHRIHIEGAVCSIRRAQAQPGVPLCGRCWCWGHSTQACRRQAIVCPRCGGPHKVENHRALASCCKGHPKASPPIPPTPAGQPCPHQAHCRNCDGAHAADDRRCPFWRNRFNHEWISMRTARQTVLRAEIQAARAQAQAAHPPAPATPQPNSPPSTPAPTVAASILTPVPV